MAAVTNAKVETVPARTSLEPLESPSAGTELTMPVNAQRAAALARGLGKRGLLRTTNAWNA